MEKIQTPIGRVSWAFVFGEGDEQEEGPSKYKMTLMLPQNKAALESLGLNPAQEKKTLAEVEKFIAKLQSECKELAKATFKKKWENTRWDPVLDGDEKESSWEGYKNFWLLRAKSKYPPQVTKPKATEGFITNGDDDEKTGFYSGCWARCFISIFAYDFKGKKGISLGLGGIQKAYNDERFESGGDKFDSDIEELNETSADFGDLE